MPKLHTFGKKKRYYNSSIDRDHYHQLVLGKVRTKQAVFCDDLAQLNIGPHIHPMTYDKQGNAEIGNSEGHDHEF